VSNVIRFGVLIVGAIVIALVARVLIASAMHPSVPVVVTKKVRISAADLPEGLLLREEDLAWKEVPAQTLTPAAIIFGAPDAVELKGALLRHPMKSGTVIVAGDVILPDAPGFLAATLKPDMRAVSVAVDDVSGNAGLIQPGDYVDLLLTQQMNGKTNSYERSVSSETVVEHVRVLASGTEISRPTPEGSSGRNNRARTVTLEVTPRMGQVVAVAAHLGSLSLELRSFATSARDPLVAGSALSASQPGPGPVWAGDVSRALRDLPREVPKASPGVQAPARARSVAVYRGSEKSESGSVGGPSVPTGSVVLSPGNVTVPR
jgi:pilus assembly protein CpaB